MRILSSLADCNISSPFLNQDVVVGNRLLMEDVLSIATLLELVKVVPKKIPKVVEGIPESVILTVIMLLVKVWCVLSHTMIVVVPSSLWVREKLIGSRDLDKLILCIRGLVLVRVSFLHQPPISLLHLLLRCPSLDT